MKKMGFCKYEITCTTTIFHILFKQNKRHFSIPDYSDTQI